MGKTVFYIPNVLNSYNLSKKILLDSEMYNTLSLRAGVAADFQIALQYPLCALP